MKKDKKQIKQQQALRRELLNSIMHVRYELECAQLNFSYVTEPALVDMYTYQIKACQAKYRYLLARAKESGLTDCGSLLAFSETR